MREDKLHFLPRLEKPWQNWGNKESHLQSFAESPFRVFWALAEGDFSPHFYYIWSMRSWPYIISYHGSIHQAVGPGIKLVGLRTKKTTFDSQKKDFLALWGSPIVPQYWEREAYHTEKEKPLNRIASLWELVFCFWVHYISGFLNQFWRFFETLNKVCFLEASSDLLFSSS